MAPSQQPRCLRGRCWWSRYERTSPAHGRGQYLPPYRDHTAEQGQPWVSRMPSLSSTIPACLVIVYGTNDHFWRG
jgi:hypothetical protein